MLRRFHSRLCPRRFETAEAYTPHAGGTTGAFNAAAVAEQLGLDPRYAQGLMMDRQNTFRASVRLYPASTGRSSKPNSPSCTRDRMFPMYARPKRFRKMLDVDIKDMSNS